MKVFKIKFSKKIKWMIYAGVALCIVCLAMNIVSMCISDISAAAKPIYPILGHSFTLVSTLIVATVLISLLTSAYYSIDNNNLISSFGIIKSKYRIKDVESISLDRATQKLFISLKNSGVISILIDTLGYEEFIDELLKNNNDIEYTINSKE